MIMKLKMLKLMTVVFTILFAASLTPSYGNGTVKKCPPKHRKHNVKRHHVVQPASVEEPCPTEPACPTAVPPCNEWYFVQCGYYAGGQLGYVNMRGKFRNFRSSTNIIDNRFKTDNGIIGELLFGYRLFWPSGVNLGVEVAGNLESTDLKRTLFPGTFLNVKFEREFSIVPAIVLGRTFQCNWNFFAKLGLGISRFETKIRSLQTGAGGKAHKTKLGVVPSMGLEYAINRNLSAIGTLTYEYYERVGTHFSIAGDNDVNTMRRVQYVAAKAGFIAKF